MSKKYGCLLAFVFFLLFISLAVNLGQFAIMAGDVDASGHFTKASPRKKFNESVIEDAKGESKAKIVHIDLDGIISSMSTEGFFMDALPDMHAIKRQLEQAVADENAKAVVLRINSPGGEVTASDILYDAVKKAAAKKPVVVYMDSMAASGGYYVACGATKIVASETTLTGSIGVIIETMSYHELFSKVGLGTQTFTSGAFKDSLSGARPMRDDEKAYVQNLVSQMYDRFLGIVSAARQQPADLLKATVADGRVVTGREALNAKLVDQIGYVEDAYALARELGKSPDAAVVKYRHEVSLFDALGLATARSASAQPVKVEVGLGGGALPRLQPGVLYYLPSIFAR
ncbi:MAG: signal peptide peptidase SppA [Verrucomicrobiaceae bacterium]|jgi:protease-4|nr:signal peptide peptidase SppA [Verrucomicrobiaceae bacterium]